MTRVDIHSGGQLKSGDTEPDLAVQLYKDNNNPRDLTDAEKVALHLAEANETDLVVDDDTTGNVSIENSSKGQVVYEWQSLDTETPGTYRGEFVVTDTSGEQETFPNAGYFHVHIDDGLKN